MNHRVRRNSKKGRRKVYSKRSFPKPDFSGFDYGQSIDFGEIFGVSSLGMTISVLIRLQRAKRISGAGTAKKYWRSVARLRPEDDIFPGRRYHHLTPHDRREMPYEGNDASNLLLIRKGRHKAWHRQFGSRTLEEILVLLLRLHRIGRNLCRFLCQCYVQACQLQRSQQRHQQSIVLSCFSKRLFRFRSRGNPRAFFICAAPP